ncbi:histidine phosphatase family protein [Beduinella massiliensis]|uniref:histidine phosphatase family protein n=1 Tax=Beduinella massiliensis TaxID=1852363 RepID=UPI000C8222F2
MRILIIRHGEPDYAIDSLTDKGWKEAELLSRRLVRERMDAIYVSPLGRAQDTARPTLDKLHRTARVLPWLQEFPGRAADPDTGDQRIPWNLRPQYWTAQPELYDRDAWRNNAFYCTGDVAAVYDEVAGGIDALLAGYGYHRAGGVYCCQRNDETTLALFCHFGLGMALLSHLLGVSPTVMWQCFFMPTSSVTTLITEERVRGEVFFKCMQLGDTSHLYAEGEPVSHSGLYCEVYGAGDVKEAQ